jgi:hypothetical protein
MDQMVWDFTMTSVRAIRTLPGSYAILDSHVVFLYPSFLSAVQEITRDVSRSFKIIIKETTSDLERVDAGFEP